jgi:hypothetical protein
MAKEKTLDKQIQNADEFAVNIETTLSPCKVIIKYWFIKND